MTLYFFINFSYSLSAVIWKSDGTILDEKGNIVKESYGIRFQKQLSNPTLEWPKALGSGKNPKNYFGNEILIPGTPLLRMSGINLGSKYLDELSKLNNFENIEDLQKFIIGNANNFFLDKLNISEENAIVFISSNLKLTDLNMGQNKVVNVMQQKLHNQISQVQKKLDQKITENLGSQVNDQLKQQVKNNVDKKIKEQVNQQVKNNVDKKIKEQVNQQVQEQVYESLNEYFDRLEAEYKAKGWTVCSRTEDTLSASSRSDGCSQIP